MPTICGVVSLKGGDLDQIISFYFGFFPVMILYNLFFLSCYENNYMAIDQNKINSNLATTDNYKFSHKHIKPTHTGKLLIDTHNMTHLSDFPNCSKFRKNAIMLP